MKFESAVPTVGGGVSPASSVTMAEGKLWVACAEGEGDNARLFELKLAAEEGEIVGEELHGVLRVRLVALSMPAEIDGK